LKTVGFVQEPGKLTWNGVSPRLALPRRRRLLGVEEARSILETTVICVLSAL
jgi:hypothetical protein